MIDMNKNQLKPRKSKKAKKITLVKSSLGASLADVADPEVQSLANKNKHS